MYYARRDRADAGRRADSTAQPRARAACGRADAGAAGREPCLGATARGLDENQRGARAVCLCLVARPEGTAQNDHQLPEVAGPALWGQARSEERRVGTAWSAG